jgi:hypothetical protein
VSIKTSVVYTLRYMHTQKTVKWFAWVLLVIGILGFIPGVVSDMGIMLGVLRVDVLHNIIYIVTGLVGMKVAGSFNATKTYFKTFGIVYAVLAILGFISSAMILGMTMNIADNVFHLIIAAIALYYGFRMETATSME